MQAAVFFFASSQDNRAGKGASREQAFSHMDVSIILFNDQVTLLFSFRTSSLLDILHRGGHRADRQMSRFYLLSARMGHKLQ